MEIDINNTPLAYRNVTGNEKVNDLIMVQQAIPAEALATLVASYKADRKSLSVSDVATFAAAQGIGADGLYNALCRCCDNGTL